MNALRPGCINRLVVWLVAAAMLLPVLSGCVTRPPPTIRLDGIVVDGQRLARPDENGLASVVRNGVSREARAGMELLAGDRINTGPAAYVVIRYPSGTEVLMRPRSSGRIGSFTDVIGEIFTKVRGVFSVETSFVKAGARGTAYLVRSSPAGTTTVIVFEGEVVVESTRGAWPAVTLGPGTMVVAYPRPPQPVPAGVEDMQRTRDWVERLERLVPPKTGISGAGVAVGAAAIAVMIGAILAGRNSGGDRPSSGSSSDARPSGGASTSRSVPSTPPPARPPDPPPPAVIK